MPVKQVSSLKELKDICNSQRLTVVDCFAQWCGPCRQIGPVVEQLSRKYATTNFVKVDVDEAEEVARHLGVRAMPTFVFFKGGLEITRMEGADPDGLEEKIKEHSATAFEGTGHRLGDVASSSSSGAAAPPSSSAAAATAAPAPVPTTVGSSSAPWPLTVPEGETPGKLMLQMPDGERNACRIAPNVHTVKDLYNAVAIMNQKPVGAFTLSVREGMRPVELDINSTSTLKDAHCAGAIVIFRPH